MRLSPAQKRHLVELFDDGNRDLCWRVAYGSPAHRCALVLARKNLVQLEGSIISRSGGGFVLTDAGREVAQQLAEATA